MANESASSQPAGGSPTVREGFRWIILTPLLTRGLLPQLIILTPLLTRGLLPQLIQIVDLKANRTGARSSDSVEDAHDFAVRN